MSLKLGCDSNAHITAGSYFRFILRIISKVWVVSVVFAKLSMNAFKI